MLIFIGLFIAVLATVTLGSGKKSLNSFDLSGAINNFMWAKHPEQQAPQYPPANKDSGGTSGLSALLGGTSGTTIKSGAPSAGSAQPGDKIVIPLEKNFDVTLLTVTDKNDNASIKSYAGATASAAAGLDLINDWQNIAAQYQTLDKNTLQQLSAKAGSIADAVKKIPVPSEVLGMGERYYLVYSNYQKYIDLTLAMMDSGLTAQQRQDKYSQLQDVGNTMADQMGILATDLVVVKAQY